MQARFFPNHSVASLTTMTRPLCLMLGFLTTVNAHHLPKNAIEYHGVHGLTHDLLIALIVVPLAVVSLVIGMHKLMLRIDASQREQTPNDESHYVELRNK